MIETLLILGMALKSSIYAAAVMWLSVSAPAVDAGIISIPVPTQSYLQSTELLNVSAPEYTLFDTLTTDDQQITYSSVLELRSVPTSWGSWNSPPTVEDSYPSVAWTRGASMLLIRFDQPVYTFGLEVGANYVEPQDITAYFYSGEQAAGAISYTLTGDNDAQFFGASTTGAPFQAVFLVNSTGDDFAISEQRYAFGAESSAPEPGAFCLTLLGVPGIYAVARYSRMRLRSYNLQGFLCDKS